MKLPLLIILVLATILAFASKGAAKEGRPSASEDYMVWFLLLQIVGFIILITA